MMDATCAKEGWKKVICDYCGTTVSEEILTKNDNHAFQNGVCTVCGAEDADYVATPTFDYVLLALAARYSQKFDVIVTAENATVTGDLSIKYKRSGTVDIAVADGYKLVDVIANGQSLGAVDSVTFKKVVAPQTLVVVTEALYTNPYTDIAADNAAVQYVTENGIMTAVEESKFAPEAEATRALIANVLYAVAGKPEFEATVTVNDSTDAAILWAASDGILTPDADGLVKADTVITMADLNAALNAYAGTTDVDYIGLDAEAAAVAATRADVANTIYLFCTIPAEW
ncbi:MAG: S-layer homology domain-containing protein [Clostridia bacterium]|nr:S-layer homology domain-containing protein [Clostridia bacterium]